MSRAGSLKGSPAESRVPFGELGEHYVQAGRWSTAGVTAAQVDSAEQWTLAASKWEVAGGWRAKWLNGSLWIRMLSMQPHWAERSSVLRLLLAAVTLRQQPQLPAFDVVYVHNDRDPAPRRRGRAQSWPLLTNAHEQGRASLPLPDYSLAGWHTHTPPWCTLAQSMQDAAARAGPWDNRTDLAFFSGNLKIGAWRKALRRLTIENRSQVAGLLRVRDVGSTFFVPGAAGPARGKPAVPPLSEACGYRYLLSLPGFGYSNRLKALLSCGSVVVHVRAPWEEWFMPLLVHQRHLVVVSSVEEILPAVHRLRATPQLARRIARGGAHAARSFLGFDRAVEYTHQLLSAYGRASEAAAIPAPDANYSRVASVRDLARLVQLCDCGATKAGAARQPTRARCAAQFGVDGARGAQRQRGGFDRFRAARCCEGWDCPRPVCEDGGRLGPNASVLMMRGGRSLLLGNAKPPRERLLEIEALHKEGLLSEAEHVAMKQRVLALQGAAERPGPGQWARSSTAKGAAWSGKRSSARTPT